VYEFGKPYDAIHNDLQQKDERLYTQNGLLTMLDRNRQIKLAPEKWQDTTVGKSFDIVFTCEERVFDAVCEGNYEDFVLRIGFVPFSVCFLFVNLETIPTSPYFFFFVASINHLPDLNSRSPRHNTPVHVVNIEITDNAQEAAIGGQLFAKLVKRFDNVTDLDQEISAILLDFCNLNNSHQLLHSVCYH
jgi:RNA polymerase II subunit A C-terminal domain phosphatase SSU72